MATTRVLSKEDGALNTSSIVTSRSKAYVDIDLSFTAKPSGEIYVKKDAAAVKQAVKNLILTDHYEKPFQPFYGGNIRALLFELADDTTLNEVEGNIRRAIETYEPRARIVSIQVDTSAIDYNSLTVSIEFQIVNTSETVSITVALARLR